MTSIMYIAHAQRVSSAFFASQVEQTACIIGVDDLLPAVLAYTKQSCSLNEQQRPWFISRLERRHSVNDWWPRCPLENSGQELRLFSWHL